MVRMLAISCCDCRSIGAPVIDTRPRFSIYRDALPETAILFDGIPFRNENQAGYPTWAGIDPALARQACTALGGNSGSSRPEPSGPIFDRPKDKPRAEQGSIPEFSEQRSGGDPRSSCGRLG
jgi:hypothetical protein